MARAGGDPHRRAPGYSAKWLKKTAVMVMMMMVMVMMMTTMRRGLMHKAALVDGGAARSSPPGTYAHTRPATVAVLSQNGHGR